MNFLQINLRHHVNRMHSHVHNSRIGHSTINKQMGNKQKCKSHVVYHKVQSKDPPFGIFCTMNCSERDSQEEQSTWHLLMTLPYNRLWRCGADTLQLEEILTTSIEETISWMQRTGLQLALQKTEATAITNTNRHND